MKNRTLRIWEFALIIGLAVSLLMGMANENSKRELTSKLLRLHVIAPSDSAEDQALKMRVRDRVLETAGVYLMDARSADDAVDILNKRLPELQTAAHKQVLEDGYDYPVSISLDLHDFPTREYDGFALPAGEYESLRVVLGDGKGQNWWCVVFPPLCTAAATGEVEEAAMLAGLTENEVKLITKDSESYVIKFKCMEIWEDIKHLFEE